MDCPTVVIAENPVDCTKMLKLKPTGTSQGQSISGTPMRLYIDFDTKSVELTQNNQVIFTHSGKRKRFRSKDYIDPEEFYRQMAVDSDSETDESYSPSEDDDDEDEDGDNDLASMSDDDNASTNKKKQTTAKPSTAKTETISTAGIFDYDKMVIWICDSTCAQMGPPIVETKKQKK